MARTVELVADPSLEVAIRRLWHRLACAGLPSQAQHSHMTNRPHVTLTRCEVAEPQLAEAMAAAAEFLPTAASLESWAYLGNRPRQALVATVAATRELLALHRRVHELITTAVAPPARQYWPDVWLPHVTLARRLDFHQRDQAMRVLQGSEHVEGQWASIRSYDERTRTVTTLT